MPKRRRTVIRASDLHSVLESVEGVADVGDIRLKVESADTVTTEDVPPVIHLTYTLRQRETLFWLGLIFQYVGNIESMYRWAKPPADRSNVLVDYLEVLPEAERDDLKETRNRLVHGYWEVGEDGAVTGFDRDQKEAFSYSSVDIQRIAANWIRADPKFRMVLRFDLVLEDLSGEEPPANLTLVYGGPNDPNNADFYEKPNLYPPTQYADPIKQTEDSRNNQLRESILRAREAHRSILPLLDRMNGGEAIDSVLNEASPEQIELLGSYFAPYIDPNATIIRL